MTYRELYESGVNQLKEHCKEAVLDARLLLEYICHTNRNDLLAHGDREVSEAECKQYDDFIRRRASGEPLQYITGEQDFMGLTFKVNERVLIPRQDTEILVEEVLKELHDGMRILDMCTGSGCILISLLHYSNGCQGVGADISEIALQVAAKNAGRLLDSENIAAFLQSNLFEKVTGKFDVIVSNPPYIQSSVIPTLMPEVKDHEPLLALDGAEDGLYFYRRIVQESRDYLSIGGRLYFEIGYDQAEAVSLLMAEAGFKEIRTVKDLAGLDRVVCGVF